FLEGDSLHPVANIEKMAQGHPLTDQDRAPWLAALRARLELAQSRGEALVATCSALKQRYRDFLSATVPLVWVYLKGSEPLLRARLERRVGHYMKADMLASQLADLEEPGNAPNVIVIDLDRVPTP